MSDTTQQPSEYPTAPVQASRPLDARRQPVRVGPIVWGSILLLVASLAGATAFLGAWNPTTFVWVVIAFGALIVIAGLIGAVGRAFTPRD